MRNCNRVFHSSVQRLVIVYHLKISFKNCDKNKVASYKLLSVRNLYKLTTFSK